VNELIQFLVQQVSTRTHSFVLLIMNPSWQ